MEQNAINERKSFNRGANENPFYMECIYRKIRKDGSPPIYHYHKNIELLYCLQGELKVTVSAEIITLKTGDFICISPNTPHSTRASSDYNEHICIKFLSSMIHVPSSKKIPPEDYYISLISDYELFRCNENNKDYFNKLFLSCVDNYSHDDYFKRLTMLADIMLIMSYVFNNSIAGIRSQPKKNVSSVFLKALDYIDKNAATVTLEEVADYCSLSYSYFSRTFKQIFRISFSNYIIKKRIENSMKLMPNMSMSLNDIALECGFANLSHFIKCFSSEKGMTPKQFRAMVALI